MVDHVDVWKNLLKVLQIILICKGTVFGGFVRDRIMHDYHAKLFFEKAKKQGIKGSKRLVKAYNDPLVIPEHADRLVIPADMDCFILTEEFEVLKKAMLTFGYKMKRVSAFEARKDAYVLNSPDIKIKKFVICPDISIPAIRRLIGDSLDIKIDIILSEEYKEPPFNNVDFECNALVMTPDGDIRVSQNLGYEDPLSKIEALNRIIADIAARRAVVVEHKRSRVEKMTRKMWDIIEV